MSKAIITVGVAASGKTTWAKQQHGFIICRDDIRRNILEAKLCRPLKDGELWKLWKFKDEDLVTEEANTQIQKMAELKHDIIIADTNLNVGRRQQLEKTLEGYGYEVAVMAFDVDLEEAWRRDAARADGVGHQVIFKQWMQFQDAKNFGEKYAPVEGTPKAIIVDIDGTLAHMNGRKPFDWGRVGEDDLDVAVYHMVRGFYMQGYEIIIMSGRDAVCRQETEKWLVQNNVPYSQLFMRYEGDCRKDSIVKNELFWQHVAQKYNVELVIDDRPQVVRLWMTLGLKVANMGNAWSEF